MNESPAYYYHYTSVASWEAIVRDGVIRAGKSGKVYLSPTLYSTTQEAEERLAVAGKAIECAVGVDVGSLPGHGPATKVEPLVDTETGRFLLGGGLEIVLDGDLRLPMRLFFLA